MTSLWANAGIQIYITMRNKYHTNDINNPDVGRNKKIAMAT
jgi:hypothetical protein